VAHAKAKVMALYLSHERDAGGKSAASHPGYHADAMTSEPSVAWPRWTPPTGVDVPFGGLREQCCAADTRRGASRRSRVERPWSMEEKRECAGVARGRVLCDQERFFRSFKRRQATWVQSISEISESRLVARGNGAPLLFNFIVLFR
jgi:hypothetical protein